jgi:hypothetical protein
MLVIGSLHMAGSTVAGRGGSAPGRLPLLVYLRSGRVRAMTVGTAMIAGFPERRGQTSQATLAAQNCRDRPLHFAENVTGRFDRLRIPMMPAGHSD